MGQIHRSTLCTVPAFPRPRLAAQLRRRHYAVRKALDWLHAYRDRAYVVRGLSATLARGGRVCSPCRWDCPCSAEPDHRKPFNLNRTAPSGRSRSRYFPRCETAVYPASVSASAISQQRAKVLLRRQSRVAPHANCVCLWELSVRVDRGGTTRTDCPTLS